MIRSLILIFSICFLSYGKSFSQVGFQCSVDTNTMLIGDQRRLLLEVTGPSSLEPDTISFTDWEEQGFATLQIQSWQVTSPGSWRKQIIFSVFDTGYIKLPPLMLPYRVQGSRDTAISNQISLEVNGIMVDSTGLAPIKNILKEPLTLRDFIPYIIAFAIGLAIIGLVFLRKKRNQSAPVIIEVPIPAHELALQELAKLKSRKLWQEGKIKEYQSELTHIIRAYLEDRYNIRALESTTGEILQYLKHEALPKEVMTDLDTILNMADMIKFAKARPDVNIHSVFMDKSEHFVMSTKPIEPIEEDETDD